MRKRLAFGFAAIALVGCLVSAGALYNLKKEHSDFEHLEHHTSPLALMVAEMERDIADIGTQTVAYAMTGGEQGTSETVKKRLNDCYLSLRRDSQRYLEMSEAESEDIKLAAFEIAQLSEKLIKISRRIVRSKDNGTPVASLNAMIASEMGDSVYYPLRFWITDNTARHFESLQVDLEHLHSQHHTVTLQALVLSLLAVTMIVGIGIGVDRLFRRYNSERERAEAALMESKERLSAILNSVPAGIFLVDARTHTIEDLNPAAERLLGMSPDDVEGKRCYGLITTTSPGECPVGDSKRKVVLSERYMPKVDGTPLPVLKAVSPVTLGGHDYYIESVLDISELKTAQEQLRRSSDELALRNQISETFIVTKGDGVFDKVLSIIRERFKSPLGIFGYIDDNGSYVCPSMTRDVWDMCQMPDKNIVLTPDKWGGEWGRVLTEGRSFRTNRVMNVPAGHLEIRRHMAAPILLEGKVIGALQVANKEEDYTDDEMQLLEVLARSIAPALGVRLEKERRRHEYRLAEEKLRESEARYRGIIDNVDMAVSLISPDLEILSAHAKVRQWYPEVGKSEKQLCYKAYPTPPRDEACPDCPVVAALWDGQVHESILEFDISGKPAYRRIVATPIVDQDGKVQSIIKMDEDITRKHELDDQLRQAQKMEAIGNLAGGIAHDFNNLLTAITGYGHLILSELESDSPVIKDVEEILATAKRAASLTRQLLTYSRKNPVAFADVDVNVLLQRVRSMLTRLIGEDIELIMLCSPRLCLTHVDPGQLEQVIVNLVVNARDAMTNGGLISISAEVATLSEEEAESLTLEAGDHCLIQVTDNGAGIPADKLPRIFDPFFTTKPQGKGTGLGLSTASGIIRQAKGHIGVKSTVGSGTTFSIYLPVVKEKAPNHETTKTTPNLAECLEGGE